MYFKNNKELDVGTSSSLKGIFACMVLLCHLHARVSLFSSNILGTLFSAFGYLAVSGFFFLSGYGLQESLTSKTNYIKYFPKKKIFPFFLVCSFTILIYLFRDILVGQNIHIISLLQSFLFGKTIVDNGWYLQTILLFYIIFYLFNKFINMSKINRVASNIILIFVFASYSLFCFIFKMSTTWYEASLCFPLGILYSQNKEKINLFVFKRKHTVVLFVFIFVGFILTLFLGNKQILIMPIRTSIKMISSLFFCVLSIILALTINIKNVVTSFLGKISLEIYLLQGIFLNLFKKQFIIENDILYIFIVLTFTILFSLLFHPLYKRINKFTISKHPRGS